MNTFLKSSAIFFKTHPYFSFAKPEPEFAKELCYSNLTRVWVAFYGFLIIGLFFFVIRLALFNRFHQLPGYTALIILNTVIMGGSTGFIFLFRSFMPEGPEKLRRSHDYLLHASILFFILVMGVSSGVEYLGTGSLSRLFFAIVAICIFITINWYVLLFYVFTGILTTTLTIFLFNGDVIKLGVENMHAPVVLFVTWLISRVFYLSSVRDYHIRKELEMTNLSLKDEIKSRLKIMETLEKSEKYMKVLFEKAPDAYMIYDAEQGVFVESNSYAEELFLLGSEDVYGKNYRELDILSPEQIEFADSIVAETLKNSYAGPYEFELVRKDGRKIAVEMRSSLAMFQGKTILFGIARDITWRRLAQEALKKANIDLEEQIRERTERFVETKERLKQEISDHRKTENVLRQTEEQSRELLRKSEEMTRTLLDAAQDSVVMIAPDGTILLVNEMLAKNLNSTSEELKGKNIFNLIRSVSNPERKKKLKEAMDKREPVIFDDLFFGRHFVLYVHPIVDNGKTIERIAVFGRDVTDLKKAERHIHSLSQELIKVQENERQRISRDLHDNVAQELASLKISCDTMFDTPFDYPRSMVQKVEGISKVLHHTIMNVRNLAYDLRPPGLDQLGLVRTISNYCDEFSRRNTIPIDFFSAGMANLHLNEEAEINLYRIVQEALHNIIKHAGANQVVIRLISSFPTIILRIEDNGTGFEVIKRLEKSLTEKRMGVRSMQERASILQGRIDIRSLEGKGTKIMVEIPVEANTRIEQPMEGEVLNDSATVQ